jgi:hypothetical protein
MLGPDLIPGQTKLLQLLQQIQQSFQPSVFNQWKSALSLAVALINIGIEMEY